jgi:O-succinylhomoserine sulfhydrylase
MHEQQPGIGHRDTQAVRVACPQPVWRKLRGPVPDQRLCATSAEAAAKRFAGDEEGYTYGRYGNPTVTSFEQRLAALRCRGGHSQRLRVCQPS